MSESLRQIDHDATGVGLPVRPFFYTPDQLAALLQVQEDEILTTYLWFIGRNFGVRPRDRMKAVNIAPDDAEPRWRVAEQELIAWLNRKGIKLFVPGRVR